MSETNRFLNRREVAELFGVTPRTVTRRAREGVLELLQTPGGQHGFDSNETCRMAESCWPTRERASA